VDEFHQYFVPNRTLSFWDFTADVIGILLGIGLARRWDRKRN
jgi:VanZ family protein